MKMTLTTSQTADQLLQDPGAKWTYNGAHAMIQHLEQDDEEMELDVIAIRCEWTEYTTALGAITDLGYLDDISGPEADEDDREAEARKMLERKTTVIEFEGGIIVGSA